jgi:hypothetical protein
MDGVMTCLHRDEPGPFCRQCGSRLTWQCACHGEWQPYTMAVKFCRRCGAPKPEWVDR